MSIKWPITRFAPSPTGSLHIGGARTALFNWAFARRHGGRFVLRIEDTDRARSSADATRRIIADMRWLGLDWDEGPEVPGPWADALRDDYDPYAAQTGSRGPYIQSQRREIYRAFIDRLIASDRAYKCFKTADELAAKRARARAEKRCEKYDPAESLALSPRQIAAFEAEGRPCVIRFRMPEANSDVTDLVLGNVAVKSEDLEDFVIRRSDGCPTFHLANVVDDHLMGVTHVIRGQEHLSNTPKHLAIQDALGIERPQYAHIPLILNPDGSKMSKREKAKAARQAAAQWLASRPGTGDAIDDEAYDALAARSGITPALLRSFLNRETDDPKIVQALANPGSLALNLPEIDVFDFRRSGYSPEVLCNYMALLGWNPGNDVERFDTNFLTEHFDLERIGKANARFDRKKLVAFNAEAISGSTPDSFLEQLVDQDKQFHNGQHLNILGPKRFRLFSEAYRPRARTLEEPFVVGRFFFFHIATSDYDEKAVAKVLKPNNDEGFELLRQVRVALEALHNDRWTVDAINEVINKVAASRGVKLGKVAQPLRVAVSGGIVSPPIDQTLSILGKDHTRQQIDGCLQLNASKLEQK